ncbi:cytochrome-c peroxidase [Flectobacillus sp. BAB-3569]|uniref:cytochrome-c peroxidase n=1 Tax=Flectobacillus sp. BAB-3569 TaxID=1509483 RepID=UPI000BA4B0D1|nr:cytochrome c peroxidase [Flectobacillus sp. BAB-3569]PAC29791.1 cytochrome C peroxidase [Flectobacillus sp. BAB-3569]
MKKYTLLFFIFLLWSCEPEDPAIAFKKQMAVDLGILNEQVSKLQQTVVTKQPQDSIQNAFLQARIAYKKIEFITEYFMPSATRLVNGAPLNEIELEENMINEPGGFQVIEEYVFPKIDTASHQELIHQINKLQTELKRYQTLQDLEYMPSQCLDAARLELFRISSLGLSGFDTPLSQNKIAESKAALAHLPKYLDIFGEVDKDLAQAFSESIQFLETQKSENFDAMTCIKQYIQPLTKSLVNWQKLQKIAPMKDTRILSAEASSYFDTNAFSGDFYTHNAESHSNPAKSELGQMLFFDPVLSSGNGISCGTCHQPDKAFTDGLKKAKGISGKQVQRNTPTLMYAGLQSKQFYDLSVSSLEEQAEKVVHNPLEMKGNLEKALSLIEKDEKYKQAIQKAFPKVSKLETRHLRNAIASYVRSLSPFNSRFDQYMKGKGILDETEKVGFNLFMGKAKCGTCHFFPLFNGTVPPDFQKTESEVLGVFDQPRSKTIDKDLGRGTYNPQIADWHFAFKTPTIRNIEKTAPYMHNGAYPDLNSVIDFYDHGGALGLGVNLENQTLSDEQLKLSKAEKTALIAFLKTLTDR